MRKGASGFTIVELLIAIVVIAILAAISIVAFTGIQSRARDSERYADAKAIIKALDLYKIDNGTYPPTGPTGAALCATGHTNGYDYSDATDGRWLQPLVTNKYITTVPTAPGNGCTSFYRYLRPTATDYSCSRSNGYYVLEVVGVERLPTPSDASDPADGSNWRPCTGATAGWGAGAATWVFTKDDN